MDSIVPMWCGCSRFLLLLVVMVTVGYSITLTPPRQFTMPGETCGYIVENGDQFKVVSQQVRLEDGPELTAYLPNVSCTISFRGRLGQQNFIRLSSFEVELSTLCASDGLYLYDGGRELKSNIMSANQRPLCGTTLALPNYYVTSGHEVTLKFVTDGRNNSFRGFTVLITPFTETDKCDGFACRSSKRCITKDALCNNEDQCKDASDEPPNCLYLNAGFRFSCWWCTTPLLLLTTCVVVTCQWMLSGSRPFIP